MVEVCTTRMRAPIFFITTGGFDQDGQYVVTLPLRAFEKSERDYKLLITGVGRIKFITMIERDN